jgi:hypothetical protein
MLRSCPTEILPDERKASANVFPGRTLAWFARHGVTVERIMTDNGSAYRSHAFRHACAAAGLRHLCTTPYTPRTDGKAERFIQTFGCSQDRAAALPCWLHLYNVHRPHAALAGRPPISRMAMTNLLGNDPKLDRSEQGEMSAPPASIADRAEPRAPSPGEVE